MNQPPSKAASLAYLAWPGYGAALASDVEPGPVQTPGIRESSVFEGDCCEGWLTFSQKTHRHRLSFGQVGDQFPIAFN